LKKSGLLNLFILADVQIFERTYDRKTKQYEWNFPPVLKGQRSVWRESTRPNALFLSTAIQLNSTQLLPVFEWFQKRLVVVVGETKFNAGLTLNLLEEREGKEKLLSFMKEADLGITDIELKRESLPVGNFIFHGNAILEHKPGQLTPNQIKVTFSHPSDDKKHSSLDLSEESNGTQTFFRTAGAWANIFKNGEVLLFDEIESSYHPLLVRFLIKKFHSAQNDNQNSQLIFATQSPVTLDQGLMRRDQIWFVEKDRMGGSKVYPLTDFKPRNDEVLERWYMKGRYGALPIITDQ
jgi:AAA15 family ATPase/GTPase